jgi:nucleotide-binding universal stress UspA family protein
MGKTDLPTRRDTGPVLVAVSGQSGDWDALEWAAAEAAARQCSLRILHAFSWPGTWDGAGAVCMSQRDPEVRGSAALVLEEAASRARTVAPGLQVTTHLREGPTVAAVLREGRRDELIVVGRGRHDGRHAAFAGSVAWQVAQRADCPVVVIRLVAAQPRGTSAGRVLVGIDEAATSRAAVDFAFRAAERRGVGLTALHVVRAVGPDAVAARAGAAAAKSFRWKSIDDAIRPYRDAFPSVEVQQRLVATPTGPALAAESVAAALLVLGGSPHGRLRRTLCGSVGRTVMCSAHSSVAIVRTLPASSLLGMAGGDPR